MTRSALLALPFVLAASSAWATVRIDVNWDQIDEEVQPAHVTFSNRAGTSIILNNDGSVTKASTGGTSTNTINGYVSSINKAGIRATAHYKISNGSIIEFYENEYIRQTVAIRTNGESLCTATVHSSPPRGQRFMTWPNPTRYIARVSAVNINCRIQKLN